MDNIELICVHYADSFAKTLERMGAPTERLFSI